jgi:hypothetical protein
VAQVAAVVIETETAVETQAETTDVTVIEIVKAVEGIETETEIVEQIVEQMEVVMEEETEDAMILAIVDLTRKFYIH